MAAWVSHIKSWERTAERIYAEFWTSACGAGQSFLAPTSRAIPLSFWCLWHQILQFGFWRYCCVQMSVGFLLHAPQCRHGSSAASDLSTRLELAHLKAFFSSDFPLVLFLDHWRVIILFSFLLLAVLWSWLLSVTRTHTHVSGWSQLILKAVLRREISSSQGLLFLNSVSAQRHPFFTLFPQRMDCLLIYLIAVVYTWLHNDSGLNLLYVNSIYKSRIKLHFF